MNFCLIMQRTCLHVYTDICNFFPLFFLSCIVTSIEIISLVKCCKSVLSYLSWKTQKTKHSSRDFANYSKIDNTFIVVHGTVIEC